MNSIKYDYENRTGWRVWSKEHHPVTDADVQGALAVYLAIDPNVRKVNIFVEGRVKDSWVHESGQWTLFERPQK